jgi:hypothetical protein
VLWGGCLAQAQAVGQAERGQKADAPVREGGNPARGVHFGVEDGWVRRVLGANSPLDQLAEEVETLSLSLLEKGFAKYWQYFSAATGVVACYSVFIFGFFRSVQKGISSVLDLGFAAALIFQLTVFLGSVALIWRVTPIFLSNYFYILYAVFPAHVERVRRYLIALAYVAFIPLLTFCAAWAYLDFKGAFELTAMLLLPLFVFGFYLFSENRRIYPDRNFKDTILGVREDIYGGSLLVTYRSIFTVSVACLMLASFLIGAAKFKAIVRQEPIYVAMKDDCFTSSMLGANSNGIILLGKGESSMAGYLKYETVFIPFESIEFVSFFRSNDMRCIDPRQQSQER